MHHAFYERKTPSLLEQPQDHTLVFHIQTSLDPPLDQEIAQLTSLERRQIVERVDQE